MAARFDIALCMGLIFVVGGCGDVPSRDPILGKWRSDKRNASSEYFSDGTITVTIGLVWLNGKWTRLSDDRIEYVMTGPRGTVKETIETVVTEDSMTGTNPDGTHDVWTRPGPPTYLHKVYYGLWSPRDTLRFISETECESSANGTTFLGTHSQNGGELKLIVHILGSKVIKRFEVTKSGFDELDGQERADGTRNSFVTPEYYEEVHGHRIGLPRD